MVSRIVTEKTKASYPDNDIEEDDIGLAHGRCLKYYNITEDPYGRATRYKAKNEEAEPLISKGNSFDGVLAEW
jgi:hypothetical protein